MVSFACILGIWIMSMFWLRISKLENELVTSRALNTLTDNKHVLSEYLLKKRIYELEKLTGK